jgi:AcrR family transcriptional regulator
MHEKKKDRRINRTRKLMQDALMSLIIERGYENVTVQDIIDRADVGRSTFYAHFRDRDELLISWFEHLRTLFEQQHQELLDARKTGKEPGVNIVLDLFRHTGNHHRLYKAVAGRQSGEMILKYLHRYLTGLLLPILEEAVKKRPSLPIPVEVTTHHLVSSLLSLMTWWLDRNMPYPPEKMEGMFRTLVRPSLETALGYDIVQDAGKAGDGGLKNEEVIGFYSLFADPSCCR